MKEIAWFDTGAWERPVLKGMELPFEVSFYEEPLNEETVEKADGADAVSVFVDSEVSSEVIEQLDAGIIACRSTGYDHVAVDAASDAGITVCNVPEYSTDSVAEHTFALLLSMAKNIIRSAEQAEDLEFSHEGLCGMEISGMTIGIVGTGAIGKRTARIADGFDMDVVAFDPSPDEELESEGVQYVGLESLLQQADVVSLHCPLMESTHHLLSFEEFELMEEVVLINTARGGLIETDALLEALENGSVRAAGLDVLEEECMLHDDAAYLGDIGESCDLETVLENHRLIGRDDVVVTPHNAFNTAEALRRLEKVTLDNLESAAHPVN